MGVRTTYSTHQFGVENALEEVPLSWRELAQADGIAGKCGRESGVVGGGKFVGLKKGIRTGVLSNMSDVRASITVYWYYTLKNV